MINTLWTFGDSFTFGHGCREDCPSIQYDSPELSYYKDYKEKTSDIWPNLLGELINYKVNNFGENGDSNDQIIDKIIDNISSISKEDIVIIGKTYSNRIDAPGNERFFTNFYYYNYLPPAYKNKIDTNFTQEQINSAIEFSYFFAMNPLVHKRNEKRYNFILKYLNEKDIANVIWDVPNTISNYEDITKHTNGKIYNTHFSFNGHKQFANYLYNNLQFQNII